MSASCQLLIILQIIPEILPSKKTEESSQSSHTIYGRPPMEDDDDDDNGCIDFDFQLDSFTPHHIDVQANLTHQEDRRPGEHSAWRPSTSGSTGLIFVNASPLLVNAGVGRGKSKVSQTAARKGGLNIDVKSEVLREIRAAKEREQVTYADSWNYIRSDPRYSNDSADNSSDENDEIYIGGLSSDGTGKQGNQSKEICPRHNTCTDDSLLDQLHKSNPKLPRHFLQRAVRMHSESACGAYLSHFESQNRKWLRASAKILNS